MRVLALLLLWPALAGAETLADTHFSMNFCWEAAYGAAHLAENPEQTVTAFRIRREPAGTLGAPGQLAMGIEVTFRGGDGGRMGRTVEAVAHCEPDNARLRCRLERRGGGFEVQAEGRGVLVTVGERGMTFGTDEVRELRPDEGGDREFLLRSCG